MKIGLSTYSLSRAINAGEMDILGAIRWIAENGGEHVEVCVGTGVLAEDDKLVAAIVKEAKAAGLDISSYTLGASFIQESDEEYRAEIGRVKGEVDIGHALGVKFMRHDAASRPVPEATVENFSCLYHTFGHYTAILTASNYVEGVAYTDVATAEVASPGPLPGNTVFLPTVMRRY